MGSSQGVPSLNEDDLEDYASLTYLNKGEILYLMKKFHAINPDKMNNNPQYRFSRREVIAKFDVLKTNPLQDRIFSVFSSKNDDCLSFEDMLDLCSAMSPECPTEVKAEWAFRIYGITIPMPILLRDCPGRYNSPVYFNHNNNYLRANVAVLRIKGMIRQCNMWNILTV